MTQQRKTKAYLQRRRTIIIRIMLIAAVLAVIGIGAYMILRPKQTVSNVTSDSDIDWSGAPDIDVQLLTVNEYSRPGIERDRINGIVIHYTSNPGSDAQGNRDYFENLMDSHETKASSHFVIGLSGQVIQCVPTSEIAYTSNDRNIDTIGIECCHPDESGQFTKETYQSAVDLTAWLCKRFGLTEKDVIRHYDVSGKQCPKYYVEHPEAWDQFRVDVGDRIKELEE